MPRWGRGRKGRGGWRGQVWGYGGPASSWNWWPRGYCRRYYWSNVGGQYNQPFNQSQGTDYYDWYSPRGRWWGGGQFPPNMNQGVYPANQSNIHYLNSSASVNDIKKRAKEILKQAITGVNYPGSPGVAIIYNGNVVGYLWDNVPLSKLELGTISNNYGKWYVPLIYKNKIVGYLLI